MVKSKRILFLIGLLLISIMGVNAGTTYLNSCGKNSGWLNNEIYYINFTEIPSGYVNDYCFYIPYGNYINITFEQITPKIIVNKEINNAYPNNKFNFFNINYGTSFSTPTWLNNSYFNNINLKIPYFTEKGQTDTKQFNFINYPTGSFNNVVKLHNNNFNNITIDGLTNFWHNFDSNADSNFMYNNLTNLNLKGQCFYTSGTTSYMQYNEITNSILNLDIPTRNCFIAVAGYQRLLNTNFTNNVFYTYNSTYTLNPITEPISTTTFIRNSIVQGIILNDSNNDNIADLEIKTYMINSGVYVDINNYRFIQDYTNANAMNIQDKTSLIPINNGVLGSPITRTLQSNLDNSLIVTNFTQAQGLIIIDKIFNCDFIENNLCQVVVRNDLTSTSSNKFYNYISVQNNALINNIDFNLNDGGTGFFQSSIIGNNLDINYNNITVKNSLFDFNSYLGDSTHNRELIKLKGTNININNNNFTTNTSFLLNPFSYSTDIIYIESLNPTKNKVYNNYFLTKSDLIVAYRIFEESADTLFYNNYLNNNTVIASVGLDLNINATPYISYLANDNKIYYWYIGNYYESNTACIDSDNDGFCDSSYTSGGVVDSHPLSSYPFDFESHLLTADLIITPNDYNITLINIVDDENVTLASSEDSIILQFSQNSDFIDLTCDYILDGISINTISEPIKDVVYNFTQTGGWLNKTYSYRVECINDIWGYKTSDEINFNVVISSGSMEENETITDGGGFIGGLEVTDLFSDDPLESAQAVKDNFKLLDRFFGTFTIMGFLAIFISILILIGGLLFFFFN